MTASQEPKVSVVVPVYGVEAYIGQCVRSLFSQTWDNCEFIFVDDGSPDNSLDTPALLRSVYGFVVANRAPLVLGALRQNVKGTVLLTIPLNDSQLQMSKIDILYEISENESAYLSP